MALTEYLESKPLPLPTVVAEAPAEETAARGSRGLGYVTLAEGEGALLLRDADGGAWRLSWERTDDREPPSDRRRALPPGSYVLVGYRVIDRSHDGQVWHLSATGQKLRRIEVDADELTPIEIDSTIHMGKRARKGQVAMSIVGEHHAGLSIYKDGTRIPIRYRLRGPHGRILSEGAMNYG